MSDNNRLNSILGSANEGSKSDISVTLNRNNQTNDEIDLVRVFKYMGNKCGIFVTLMILLAVIGLSGALCLAEFSRKSSDAVASIEVLYSGDYNVDSLTSAYVVKNALAQAGLSGQLSVDSVRNNISVSRVLNEEYRQKVEMYSKLDLSADTIKELLAAEAEYEDVYIVTLKNGFGEKEKKLSDSEITVLLNSIIYQFNQSFFDDYSKLTLPENGVGGFDYTTVEYSQAVSILKQSFKNLRNYCKNISKLSPDFSRGGLTFSDMADLIDLSYSAQASYFEAYVFYTNTVRDKEMYKTYYTHYIRNYKTELLNAESKIANYDEIIKNFKNETVLVLSSSAEKEMQTIVKNLDAYNQLVLDQADNYKEKAVYEKLISDYEERLKNIQSAGTVGVHDYAEFTVASIISAYSTLYADVCEMAESFMTSSGYQGSFISFTTSDTSNTGFFSSANIKNALIGAAAGAFVGFLVWGVYGLVIELKRSSKKREEAENE